MIVVLHLIIIFLIYISPFFFSWKAILAGVFLYYLQLVIFGRCILTTVQFKELDPNDTFYAWVFIKLGFTPNKRMVRIIADYYIPWIILGAALLWQIYFKHAVFFSF